MIEETVRDYLSGALDCPVWMEYPENPPDRFVLLEKTGSGRGNYISRATFAVQSYGESLYEAARLNEKVKKAMDNLIFLNSICDSSLNSDYAFNDTTNHRYRYQAVYDIVHYS